MVDLGVGDETIRSLQRLLAGGEMTGAELVARCLQRIESGDSAINTFTHLDPTRAIREAERVDRMRSAGAALSPLAGIPIAVKDNIAVKGMPLTCASRILEGYVSPYDATVVRRLRRSGAIVLGKTNMDEFGMGSSNENSSFGNVRNPWDAGRVPGGSSGGSAATVAAGFVPAALGSDTGGSVRQPASFCGLVGLKPTYGRVSRYGLVSFASSLDHIGLLTRDVRDAALLLREISGYDPKDSTSRDLPVPDFVCSAEEDCRGRVIGVPNEFFSSELRDDVRDRCETALDAARAMGMAVKRIDLPFLRYTLPAYYILSAAEASSNLARYDGIRYGSRRGSGRSLDRLVKGSRSAGFGREVKRRIMLGTYVLSRGYYDTYYMKGFRARAYFISEISKAFEAIDLIASPTTPTPAFAIGEKVDDPVEMYLSDVFTTVANLTGVPAVSIPCGRVDRLPVGLQIMAKPFDEATMLSAARTIEAEIDAGSI